jgi:hypothetical protein
MCLRSSSRKMKGSDQILALHWFKKLKKNDPDKLDKGIVNVQIF